MISSNALTPNYIYDPHPRSAAGRHVRWVSAKKNTQKKERTARYDHTKFQRWSQTTSASPMANPATSIKRLTAARVLRSTIQRQNIIQTGISRSTRIPDAPVRFQEKHQASPSQFRKGFATSSRQRPVARPVPAHAIMPRARQTPNAPASLSV